DVCCKPWCQTRPRAEKRTLDEWTFPRAKRPLMATSSFGGRSGCRAEPNSKSIEGVHQTDRIGQVGEFFVAEFGGGGFVVSIGNAGLGDACYGFRPGERDAFAG